MFCLSIKFIYLFYIVLYYINKMAKKEGDKNGMWRVAMLMTFEPKQSIGIDMP